MTFQKYDVDAYSALVQRASFRFEGWKGTIQDQSTAQRAMSYVGSPRFQRVGNVVGLVQNAVADGITSGNVASVVDVTAAFTLEIYGIGYVTGTDFVIGQLGAGNAGGFICYRQGPANNRITCELYTIAGASARTLASPIGSTILGSLFHCVLSSSAGGTAGAVWLGGIPSVVTLAGAGVAANHAGTRPIIAAGGNGGIQGSFIIRAYPFALDNSQAACLAAGAANLVSG